MTSAVNESKNLILAAIEQLRSFCQVDVLSTWRYCATDLSLSDVIASGKSGDVAQLNAKGHIAWAGGQSVLWLWQKLIIPQDLLGYQLQGKSLRLALVWWADSAQVYVNGKLVAAGDLFDCSQRVLISRAVTPGEEFTVAVRLVSPGHCDGALVKALLVYESTDGKSPEPGFVADELAVLLGYVESFAPEKLDVLVRAVGEIDWDMNRRGAEDAEDERGLEKSLYALRRHLRSALGALGALGGSKSKIFLLGHAHLDLAWLWRVSETWKAAESTFESVIGLLSEFSELIFCHSTPALYAWVEEFRPDLFSAIEQAVVAGRWEVVGAFWVEPDLNLIAGESIVRQLLYGQRYIYEKFGQFCRVVWVPDSFGFCATLPQFLVNASVEFFVTQKLCWNDTTKFDYGAFWWRSPDGSEVFSLMSARIGEGIDPVKMASYSCEWLNQTGISEALWLPGVGDHGGGPTRDMLEVARRWQQSPFFPELEFTTALRYLQDIKSGTSPTKFPVWSDELYLEFHRGCYTTHGDQKRWNRRCEGLLYQAELFAALANISGGCRYPKAELEAAWKKVLFNQFHDILPGSSITEVYVDALSSWLEVEKVGSEILQQSMLAIASQISLPEPPQSNSLAVVVFNALNWQRREVVTIALPSSVANQEWQIYDISGQQQPSQLGDASTLLFLASDIPPVGYRVFWLTPSSPSSPSSPLDWVMENEFLRVTVDAETGDLSSVFDKVDQREVLSGAGNQLQAFQDSGQYWDAWNIDPNYAQHPLPPTTLKSIEWVELGVVQSRLRVVRQLGESEFCQDYILQVRSPILKISTKVDWQERQVLVKAAFPLSIKADEATYEIPCGVISRSTQPKTPAEQAKWEVPALRWADLTESTTQNQYGVSLLNDCKYGYDSQPNQLRLTLLRSPNWPDAQADRGVHEFTYALYPHAGSWELAHTVKRGYELNIPLQVLCLQNFSSSPNNINPIGARKFLDLGTDNLILMAFKQAEDHQQDWILRCYECHGKTAELSLQSDLSLSIEESVDLLEQPLTTPELLSGQQTFTIQPWKIASFKVKS